MSIGLAVGAAALIPLAWNLLRGEEVVRPVQRTLATTEMTWRCEKGHQFQATGAEISRTCLMCGAVSYVIGEFACETHGVFEVATQLVEDQNGHTEIQRVRLPGQDWQSPEEGLICPRCGGELVRRLSDPLRQTWERSRRRGG